MGMYKDNFCTTSIITKINELVQVKTEFYHFFIVNIFFYR